MGDDIVFVNYVVTNHGDPLDLSTPARGRRPSRRRLAVHALADHLHARYTPVDDEGDLLHEERVEVEAKATIE